MLKRQKSLFSSRAYWQIINGTNLLIDETVYARTEYVLTCVIAQMCMLSCIAQCCEHSCTVFWLFCCFLDNGFSESEEACFLFSPQRSWSEPTCLIRYRMYSTTLSGWLRDLHDPLCCNFSAGILTNCFVLQSNHLFVTKTILRFIDICLYYDFLSHLHWICNSV